MDQLSPKDPNFPVFSLLTGNFGGERFALDYVLRQILGNHAATRVWRPLDDGPLDSPVASTAGRPIPNSIAPVSCACSAAVDACIHQAVATGQNPARFRQFDWDRA